MLEVRGLDAGYGAATILFDVSLDVGEGEAVALLGRNGAGKSTTLKAIAGWLKPARGEIRFGGRRIDGAPSYRIAQAGLGFVPEGRRIFTDLTVEQNLEVGRRDAHAGTPWTPQRLFLLFPALAELRDRRGGEISGGEQQMLAIARTLMGNPTLLLARRAGRRARAVGRCAARRGTARVQASRSVDIARRAKPGARRGRRRPRLCARERTAPLRRALCRIRARRQGARRISRSRLSRRRTITINGVRSSPVHSFPV